MDIQSSALILAWVAIGLLGFAVAGLTRQLKLIAGGSGAIVSGPPVGVSAPPIDGIDLSNESSTVLLFLSSDCVTCAEIIRELREAPIRNELHHLVVLFRGSGNLGVLGVAGLKEQARAFEDYRIDLTPYAVAVRAGVVIDRTPVGSVRLLREFMARMEEVVRR